MRSFLNILLNSIVVLLFSILVGCSWFQDDPIDDIKSAPASTKEQEIMFQVDHFLNSDYEVVGYEIVDESYEQSVEITLREKDGGRTLVISLEWNMR